MSVQNAAPYVFIKNYILNFINKDKEKKEKKCLLTWHIDQTTVIRKWNFIRSHFYIKNRTQSTKLLPHRLSGRKCDCQGGLIPGSVKILLGFIVFFFFENSSVAARSLESCLVYVNRLTLYMGHIKQILKIGCHCTVVLCAVICISTHPFGNKKRDVAITLRKTQHFDIQEAISFK